ncbi:MAG: hypothetical protein NT077_00855 [Candidatus Taylorbacteria bacterium]|nr:hypothetical protein [Candidatus Taylorbacteria bacterium]
MSFKPLILLGFSIVLLSSASFAQAQGIPNTIGGLELTPSISNPSPGQSVTITVRSYSVDINSATLTWTADGKTLETGIGSTVVTVKAPALGKKLTVNVTAVMPDGTSFRNELILTSGSIDMIIETNGYRPTTFLGKLPVVYQNTVKIVAVPHLANSSGTEYDPKTLLYKWDQNGNAMEDLSGYGKQSVSIPGTLIPRPYVMSVTVLTRDENAQGVGYISVTPGSPSLVFYKNDPLYGPLYNNAIMNTMYLGSQRETGVLAVPYGFNAPASGLGNLSLTWFINGGEHPELSSNQSVTLRAPDASAGSSNIQLNIANGKDILQKASASFQAVFSASATNQPVTF